MDGADLILDLDKRFSKLFSGGTAPYASASIKTPDGIMEITVARGMWARCHSRFERWSLLREHLEGSEGTDSQS